MDKIPASQGTGNRWRGTVPAWWFGAPFIAAAYVFLTPRFLPDLLPAAAGNPLVRWLVGLVIGVAIMSTWHVSRWVMGLRARNQT